MKGKRAAVNEKSPMNPERRLLSLVVPDNKTMQCSENKIQLFQSLCDDFPLIASTHYLVLRSGDVTADDLLQNEPPNQRQS
jgi:hypothetical protein